MARRDFGVILVEETPKRGGETMAARCDTRLAELGGALRDWGNPPSWGYVDPQRRGLRPTGLQAAGRDPSAGSPAAATLFLARVREVT